MSPFKLTRKKLDLLESLCRMYLQCDERFAQKDFYRDIEALRVDMITSDVEP